MMIKNGTYADFRPKLVDRAKKGKLIAMGDLDERILKSLEKIEKWDKEWDAIPMEERQRRRERVADDVEIKEKIVYTARGPMRVFKSKPSRNNNMDTLKSDMAKRKNKKLPPGFITKDNSPLAGKASAKSAPSETSKSEVGVGFEPQAV